MRDFSKKPYKESPTPKAVNCETNPEAKNMIYSVINFLAISDPVLFLTFLGVYRI